MSVINKPAIAAAFGRAASHYQQHDDLQRRSAMALLSQLPDRHFARVLDAGCGPGTMSRYWQQRGSVVTALDLSSEMLEEAAKQNVAQHYLQGDIESLPLATGSFDLVWSNLAVQWCESLRRAVEELYRVVQPGGYLGFTTLLADSLPELKVAWQAVDRQPPVNRFLTPEAIAQALAPWRCQTQHQTLCLTFEDALSAMRSLKGIGATHLHAGRQPQTLTRQVVQQLQQAWPKQQGQCTLTYHLFTGVIYRD